MRALRFLLRLFPNNPMLVTLAICLFLFLCVFTVVFGFILVFRTLQPVDRRRSREPSLTGVPYWAQPLLLLIVFPLSWMWELLDSFAPRDELTGIGIGDQLLLWLPCLLGAVLVHELGHIFAAKSMGFRIRLLRLGPLLLQRRCDGWLVRFDTEMHSMSGMVRSLPMSVENLRSDLLFITACGPAASLLFTVITDLAAVSVQGSNYPVLVYALGISATWSFLAFAASIWPTRAGYFSGDGPFLLALWLKTKRADRICAAYACASSLSTERRPRDWEPSWVSALVANGQSDADEFSGSLTAYAYALDAGRISEASAYLDRASGLAETIPGAQTRPFFFESAYFEARHRNNSREARRRLDCAARMASPVEGHLALRCEAAVLLAEGRNDEASRAIDGANGILHRLARTGEILAEFDLIRDLKLRIEIPQLV